MEFIDIIVNNDNTQAIALVNGIVVYEGYAAVTSEENTMLLCILANLENASTRATRLPVDDLKGVDLIDVLTDESVVEVFQIGGIERLIRELEEDDGEGGQ